MRNYVISARITGALTCISFAVLMIIHYRFQGTEADFWCNVCLAVFGSSLLTLITSCIGYATEKRHTLEGFSYSTRSLLHVINKYDFNWDLEKKIDFFLDYTDVDKSVWDAHYGAMYFMFDPDMEKRKYIYQKIYKPILDFNLRVADHAWHFTLHKDGSGKNDVVMANFVREIEVLFMEEKSSKFTLGDGIERQVSSVYNKLVRTISEELNGKYYNIMYGKKQTENEDA